jgi:hypothetical protein
MIILEKLTALKLDEKYSGGRFWICAWEQGIPGEKNVDKAKLCVLVKTICVKHLDKDIDKISLYLVWFLLIFPSKCANKTQ